LVSAVYSDVTKFYANMHVDAKGGKLRELYSVLSTIHGPYHGSGG